MLSHVYVVCSIRSCVYFYLSCSSTFWRIVFSVLYNLTLSLGYKRCCFVKYLLLWNDCEFIRCWVSSWAGWKHSNSFTVLDRHLSTIEFLKLKSCNLLNLVLLLLLSATLVVMSPIIENYCWLLTVVIESAA